MRHALQALTDELRRLKASGVKTVAVSDESIAALRRIVDARAAAAPVAAPRAVDPRPVERTLAPVAEKAAVPAPAIKPYEPPPFRPAAPAVASAPASTIPPAPTVTLPPGDKQTRWNALLDRVLNDPVCRAAVRPGKKVVLGVGSRARPGGLP